MKWEFKSGDILDEAADVLVCSANVYLNLSGGVGGALSLRYGHEMQAALRDILRQSGRQFVQPGEVIVAPPCGAPYKAVIHAVAVDAFYESSVDLVSATARASLIAAAKLDSRRVALTALATGYGRMSIGQFAEAIRPLMTQTFAPLEEAVVCVRRDSDRDELLVHLGR